MSLVALKIGDSIQSEEENVIACHFKFSFSAENMGPSDGDSGIIYSSTFNGDPMHGDQWRVKFSCYMENSVKVSLELVQSESCDKFGTTFQMCFLDASKQVKWAGPVKSEMVLEGRELGFYDQFSLGILAHPQNPQAADPSVTFYVQMSTYRLKPEPEAEPEPKHQVFAQEQFKSFLTNGHFSDVILASENGEFPASKIILAAQSPVFFAMFRSSMVESEANAVVKIEEFSDETVKGFLEFIYTGETASLEENAEELLSISDKYEVMALKGKCEKMLLKNLKVENSPDILVLAHLHSPEFLKPKIIPFVNEHFKELENTDSFKRVTKEYPQLIFDLYQHAMK